MTDRAPRLGRMEPTPNARTIESYEKIAVDYAAETADNRVMSTALTRLAETIPSGHVLEIGSGPGWDADFLEEVGLSVRRTDITQAFIDLQRLRGKDVARLDAISDDFGGPYDGVVVIAVLQHLQPADVRSVLAKVATALRPGGRLLVAVRLGEGDGWESGSSGNRYYRSLWSESEFFNELTTVGLTPEWTDQSVDDHDPNLPASDWLTMLAKTAR